MNTNKIALFAIAVVAIGIFALPSTVSLLSGQHTWYDLDGIGNDLPCLKCHGDIWDEMSSSLNGIHTSMNESCDCHRVTATDTGRLGTGVASGDTTLVSTPGTASHAAETIACMICHENNSGGTFGGIVAGGFNQSAVEAASGGKSTPYYYERNAAATGEGSAAAHNQFIGQAINDSLMADSNEACIACHTMVGVNITWTKNTVLEFDAKEDDLGTWNLTNFVATGDDVRNSTYKNNWTNTY